MGGIGTRIGCTHCGYEADTLYEVKSHHCYTKGAPMTDKFELIERLGLQAFDPRYALATTRKVVDAAELEALLQSNLGVDTDGKEMAYLHLKPKDEQVSREEIETMVENYGKDASPRKLLERILKHGIKD
jgi:hypothetical protein